MYNIEVTVVRKDGRTDVRMVDTASSSFQEAIALALVKEVVERPGDRAVTIKVVSPAYNKDTRNIKVVCECDTQCVTCYA